jgi:hypothetical protein
MGGRKERKNMRKSFFLINNEKKIEIIRKGGVKWSKSLARKNEVTDFFWPDVGFSFRR